jgi:hypothetical protein
MSIVTGSNEDPAASIAMLGGASGQIRDTTFVTAGNDVVSTSNVTAQNIVITIGQTTPPSSETDAMGRGQSIFRNRFVQLLLSVFQSVAHRDALHHGSQMQRILDILPPEQAAGPGDSDIQAATDAGQPDHQYSPPRCSSASNSQSFHVVSVLSVDSCRGI